MPNLICNGHNLKRKNQMMRMVIALLVGGGLTSNLMIAAQSKAWSDKGVLLISSQGRQLGTEKFTIEADATQILVKGELQLTVPGGEKVSETSQLSLKSDLRPASYEREQKSPQKGSLKAEFGDSETTLISQTTAGQGEQKFLLPNNSLAILDTNFFHHYAILVRMYDQARSGEQTFNVFIPQESLPATIRLKLVGKEVSNTEEMNHFQAITEDIALDIYTAMDGTLNRLEIPKAGIEIRRQQ